MTGSASISFNGVAESSGRVSANISCWFALRRRTSARPIGPLAPAIRTLIALPCSAPLRRLASFSMFCPFLRRTHVSIETLSVLLERGDQVFIVRVDDEDCEQLCRRSRACIPADPMDRARCLVPTFARAVDPLRFLIHL